MWIFTDGPAPPRQSRRLKHLDRTDIGPLDRPAPPRQSRRLKYQLVEGKEEPSSVLARRHGVSTNTLSQWRDEFIAGGTGSLSSGKRYQRQEAKRLAVLEAAVEERDRVIGEITIANRVAWHRVFLAVIPA